MKLNQTDLIVTNVEEATRLIEQLLDMKADFSDKNFAQFTVGEHSLMLSHDALVPMETVKSGTILHFEVEDVDAAYERLKQSGAKILHDPLNTDWGTYSLLVEGPDAVVFDFYKINDDLIR